MKCVERRKKGRCKHVVCAAPKEKRGVSFVDGWVKKK
jgi:hypothetical protein